MEMKYFQQVPYCPGDAVESAEFLEYNRPYKDIEEKIKEELGLE